ncbi:MAG: Penicillin-binding protein 1A [Alphaproteobacteria bacterium ADurb.Bin438]|nr:MAG: Penicillin-binding protein 1A [Alphaproteobacteria bacterium ADurb.Bin438]
MTKFGLDSSCVNSEILALGVCSSNLVELVSAYASISNGGYLVNPYTLVYIKGKNKLLYERESWDLIKISDEKSILTLDNMLESAVKQGTGKKAFVKGKDIKGKTGTTQNGRDAYFIGYDNNLVIGVWVGYDDERYTNITGGGLPAEIFKEIMEVIN